jgi:predicted amidohydrolase
MKVAAVQFNPLFGRVDDNINRATELITSARADLYVLPELCFSGYTFTSLDEANSLSEDPQNGHSIGRILELSKRLDSGIVFGFPEKSSEGLYNSCALICPEGNISVYRKIHLFFHEKEFFLSGDKASRLYNFRGCQLGLMVCFDWIFPEMARSLALLGAHLICHPANLVMPFCQAAMITRSLENRVFSITSNRIGQEKRGLYENKFTGQSQLISPRGQILFRASSDKEEICFADIEYSESDNKQVNPLNNLWDDRRPDCYNR